MSKTFVDDALKWKRDCCLSHLMPFLIAEKEREREKKEIFFHSDTELEKKTFWILDIIFALFICLSLIQTIVVTCVTARPSESVDDRLWSLTMSDWHCDIPHNLMSKTERSSWKEEDNGEVKAKESLMLLLLIIHSCLLFSLKMAF